LVLPAHYAGEDERARIARSPRFDVINATNTLPQSRTSGFF